MDTGVWSGRSRLNEWEKAEGDALPVDPREETDSVSQELTAIPNG